MTSLEKLIMKVAKGDSKFRKLILASLSDVEQKGVKAFWHNFQNARAALQALVPRDDSRTIQKALKALGIAEAEISEILNKQNRPSRVAAVEKVPVFTELDASLTPQTLEKYVLRNYPSAVKGTLTIDRQLNTMPGGAYANFHMDSLEKARSISGSVLVRIEAYPGGSIRVSAFVNIDS